MIVHLIKEAGVESGKSWEVGFPRQQTKVTLFTFSFYQLAKLMNMIMGLMMMMMMMKTIMMISCWYNIC